MHLMPSDCPWPFPTNPWPSPMHPRPFPMCPRPSPTRPNPCRCTLQPTSGFAHAPHSTLSSTPQRFFLPCSRHQVFLYPYSGLSTAKLFFFRSALVAWGTCVGDTTLKKLPPLPTSASLSPLLPSPQPLSLTQLPQVSSALPFDYSCLHNSRHETFHFEKK